MAHADLGNCAHVLESDPTTEAASANHRVPRVAPPNGSALSCRPPMNHDATTGGRPARPPRTRAAGGWARPQAGRRAAGQLQRLVGRRAPGEVLKTKLVVPATRTACGRPT